MANVPCPHCGRLNRAGAKFCAGCRQPLSGPTPIPPRQVPLPPTPPQHKAPTPPLPPPPQVPAAPRQSAPQAPGQPPRQPPGPAPRPGSPQPSKLSAVRSLRWWQYLLLAVSVLGLCVCLVWVALLSGIVNGIQRLTSSPPTAIVIITTVVPPLPSPSATINPTVVPIVSIASPTPVLTPSPTRQPPPSVTETATKPATPVLTATPAVSPTTILAATSTPMPTLALDTAPGTTLNVGETWRQNKMTMTVLNQRFSRASCDAIVEFTINLQNNDAIELTMDLRGSDWAVTDDQGREYSVVFNTKGSSQTDTCADYGPLDKLQQPFIASGQIITYALRVNGAFDDQVKAFVLTAKKAGRVQNAAWTIPIPPR